MLPDDTCLARTTTGSNQTVPKADGTFVKPRRFACLVALRLLRVVALEVLFAEQKSLREQLTEILQEVDDYTWTEEGSLIFN